MPDLYDFRIDRLREGQRRAYKTICERIENDQPYTAIILPTRYGKADLMRISAIQLRRHGLISAAFGLSPGVFLTGQLAKQSNWIQCIERYDLPRNAMHRIVRHPENDYTPNGESFLCATLQLVVWHAAKFADTARILRAEGRPALFFIDECHFTSECNHWGEAAEILAEAGALIVLLTATAIRADGYAPKGFGTTRVVIKEHAKRHVPATGSAPDKQLIKVYEGQEIETRIIADHETSFREAWEESPSPLCKVDYSPFDVYLSETDIPSEVIEGDNWIDARISTMNASECHKYLGAICRSQKVIKEGAARLVRLLLERRRQDDRIAAIVFCDSDRNDNGNVEVNRWANSIANAIRKTSGGEGFLTVIATSAREDEEESADRQKKKSGNDLIRDFVQGAGDILIVKQMGGAGLDDSRIKIVLDLSPVRAIPSWIQRITRAATPHNGHRTCTLITPDDCLSRSNFDRMIAKQGGSARFEGELVRTYEVDRKEQQRLHIIATGDATFCDNAGNIGEAEQYEDVRSLKELFPELQLSRSDAECALLAASFVDRIRNNKGRITNLEADLAEVRRRCTDAHHLAVMARLNGYEPVEYAKRAPLVWQEAYRKTGANPPLDEITDLKVLRAIEKTLLEMARSAGSAA